MKRGLIGASSMLGNNRGNEQTPFDGDRGHVNRARAVQCTHVWYCKVPNLMELLYLQFPESKKWKEAIDPTGVRHRRPARQRR